MTLRRSKRFASIIIYKIDIKNVEVVVVVWVLVTLSFAALEMFFK